MSATAEGNSHRRTDNLESYREAACSVAGVATRTLAIFTHDLEPLAYDQTVFLEIVKELILGTRVARVRVLLMDPMRAVREGNRFVSLGRRLSSYVEFRRVDEDYRQDPRAFIIADDRAIAYRILAARWEGVTDLNDPILVREYLDYFNKAWNASVEDQELGQFRL